MLKSSVVPSLMLHTEKVMKRPVLAVYVKILLGVRSVMLIWLLGKDSSRLRCIGLQQFYKCGGLNIMQKYDNLEILSSVGGFCIMLEISLQLMMILINTSFEKLWVVGSFYTICEIFLAAIKMKIDRVVAESDVDVWCRFVSFWVGTVWGE